MMETTRVIGKQFFNLYLIPLEENTIIFCILDFGVSCIFSVDCSVATYPWKRTWTLSNSHFPELWQPKASRDIVKCSLRRGVKPLHFGKPWSRWLRDIQALQPMTQRHHQSSKPFFLYPKQWTEARNLVMGPLFTHFTMMYGFNAQCTLWHHARSAKHGSNLQEAQSQVQKDGFWSYNPVGEYIIANCEKLVKENAGLNRG